MGLPLFVYGTLGSGFRNVWARRLWKDNRNLGPARVRGRLYLLDSYPVMTPARAAGEWVSGELVDGRGLLRWLDRYEGPEFRRRVRTVHTADGKTRRAWTYLFQLPTAGRRRIWTGVFSTAKRFASRKA